MTTIVKAVNKMHLFLQRRCSICYRRLKPSEDFCSNLTAPEHGEFLKRRRESEGGRSEIEARSLKCVTPLECFGGRHKPGCELGNNQARIESAVQNICSNLNLTRPEKNHSDNSPNYFWNLDEAIRITEALLREMKLQRPGS